MEYVQVVARVEPEIKAALDKLKESEGILIEWQMRMGLLMWLESKGIFPLRNARAKPSIAGGPTPQ